ncbi:hypothetical protein H1P_4550003 [Hyella patelloides LEGE 07179]|uniref:Uncharacterized protein n=1 Tax=Hyella patelloides LEGE 07179 TaxID=945734 RepID=A0A563VYN3_9CYAN|nr:hypothetical protein H1P_4550003 [Hyella patelloides LEGE 07179]
MLTAKLTKIANIELTKKATTIVVIIIKNSLLLNFIIFGNDIDYIYNFYEVNASSVVLFILK